MLFLKEMEIAIEKALQLLINTCHLYQSLEVDFEDAIEKETREMYARRLRTDVTEKIENVRKDVLVEVDALDWVFGVAGTNIKVGFALKPVRTMCGRCGEVLPFNTSAQQPVSVISLGVRGRQVFTIPIQCQGCRSNIIVLLVARSGRKIQLVRRSEFEEISVPGYVPKQQRSFYSRASIAFNCGEFLAGVFLLRTVIEQYMRSTGIDAAFRVD